MKLSIIIVTLNEQFYLPKLLEALTKQTFRDFGVIVVDGRSEDKTVFEAQQFTEKLPNLKIIEGERGISVQRNTGAREASTDNLLFLDADTVPTPNFLEDLMSEVEKKNLDAAIAYLQPITRNRLLKIGTFLGSVIIFHLISPIYKNTIGADFFVRRAAFESVSGFDEEIYVAEDNDLLRRLLKKGYRYAVLYRPKIHISLRRFEKEGYLFYILRTIIFIILSLIFGGKRAQKIISFEFGRHPRPDAPHQSH